LSNFASRRGVQTSVIEYGVFGGERESRLRGFRMLARTAHLAGYPVPTQQNDRHSTENPCQASANIALNHYLLPLGPRGLPGGDLKNLVASDQYFAREFLTAAKIRT